MREVVGARRSGARSSGRIIRRLAILGATCGAVCLGGAVPVSGPVAAEGGPQASIEDAPAYSDLFIPVILRGQELPFPPVMTAPPPSATVTASPTRTLTPTPTRTPTPSITPGPSPTPTRPGGAVSYPKDPSTIIVQVGWTDTEQPGAAWEEMNGTPFFSLYGDGRLIAGHGLFDWEHRLFVGQASEDQIQDWLQRLTYDIGFFTMEASYEHPDMPKYAVHIYVRFGSAPRDFRRVTLAGYPRWLREPLPPVDGAEAAHQLAQLIADLETYANQELPDAYSAEHFTIISHEINGYLASPPTWRQSLDIVAISDSAPLRPDGGNVHGPPGHLVVAGAQGAEIAALVAADAERDWPGLNLAAEYLARGRHFVVGARPEVSGGSFFLPDRLRDEWYRQD